MPHIKLNYDLITKRCMFCIISIRFYFSYQARDVFCILQDGIIFEILLYLCDDQINLTPPKGETLENRVKSG